MTNHETRTEHVSTGIEMDQVEFDDLMEVAFTQGLAALESNLTSRGLSVDLDELREGSSAWVRDQQGKKVSLVLTDHLRIAEVSREDALDAGITLTAPGQPIMLLARLEEEDDPEVAPDENRAQELLSAAAERVGSHLVIFSGEQRIAMLVDREQSLYLPLRALSYPGVVAGLVDGELFRAANDPDEGARLAAEKLGVGFTADDI